ncbi:MerR family transcriptional regulator [Aestuariimicrobium kwangyangense]|uniref:transcriptional regulator FtsR n=1 Tax=Aestuariimicrobium kwangyangense TaxID=396389 RepID=UPI0003B33113|nr:MerR family transcriptional regulator [Aestuariimicrobium kwangyangense]
MPSPVRSIGQVLALLKAEFPDVSISKIRFLESEGLLSPERAPSGYRRYAQVDIERLTYILRVQRDHYLPLKVIKDHLDEMDRGGEPPNLDAPPPAQVVLPAEEVMPEPRPVATGQRQVSRKPIRLSRRELLAASGLSEAVLVELERLQLVFPRRGGGYYGREALTICVVARKLRPYGMDSRHLRAIKQSAEREAGLVEQAIAPFVRRKDGASEAAAEVTQLVIYAHAAMMHSMLER